MTLSPGTLLNNRYEIKSILGQGGMGAVYRAVDHHLGISVAVKENLFLSDEYARQFQREASILANLKHHNLTRVGDYFDVPGQGQYLIMDYIEGEDLRERIERVNTLSEREVLLIGIAVCDALEYLHSRQPSIVHRDIKPGNIKITPDGEIILVDFGLAKVMQGNQATTTGARAMTPGYSPPEQYGTARTDARTDIYSLGATLYAALSGVIPEDGLARMTKKAQLTSLRELLPKINRELAAVIEKSLSIEPDHRYQTAKDFQDALIKCGNLMQYSQPRYRISPPPSEPGMYNQNGQYAPSDYDDIQVLQNKNRRPKAKKRRGWVIATLLLLLVAGLGTVFSMRPDIPASFSARLFSSPAFAAQLLPSSTATLQPAEIINSPIPVINTEINATDEPPKTTDTPTVEPIDGKTQIPVLLPSKTPSPQPTLLGGGRGAISFVSNRAGNFQIWLMNPDGRKPTQLTTLPNGACQPAWSPDGTKLALISPCETKTMIYPDSRIYILNADGTDPKLLPVSKGGDFDPAWSPDGRRLAFTSLQTGTSHIFVYNFDDMTLEELSDTIYADMQPSWNPTGKQIAFSRLDKFYNHIWIMSEKGQTQFQFSGNGNVNDYWPNWSANGEFIMYSRTQPQPVFPWVITLNYEDRGTGKEVRIPPLNEAANLGPVWNANLSPDMQWIVYEGWPDGKNHDIYLMDINGQSRTRLTTDPGFDFNPVWVPGN